MGLLACNLLVPPDETPPGSRAANPEAGDSVWVIVLLETVDLPETIVNFIPWAEQAGSRGESSVLDQRITSDTPLVSVGVKDPASGEFTREARYRGNPGSDTLFVGLAPVALRYRTGRPRPMPLPDTLDLLWFCLTIMQKVAFVTIHGDTIYGYGVGLPYTMADSVASVYLHRRNRYRWLNPFVLTGDTLVIGVGARFIPDRYIGLACTGSAYPARYYRLRKGGRSLRDAQDPQEVGP